MKRPPKTLTKLVLSCGAVLSMFWLVEWKSGTHYFDFQVEDKFAVELKADKCTFCLLYEPYDYHIEITDLKTEKEFDFKFHTQKGADLLFGVSENHPELFMVKGYNGNDGRIWLVDMNTQALSSAARLDSIDCYATQELTKEENDLILKNITAIP